MKFTLSLLKNYLTFNNSLDEICKTLTSIGLEVESLEDNAKNLAIFEVAKIIEAKPHENSNKLKICLVQTSDAKEPLQIICGAANARTGLKVAYAKIGAVIPANQLVIKKAKIAGVESNGMLCSAQELGLGLDGEGIIEIDEKWEIGTKITEVFSLNEAVVEINVTPNRGDCLGVYGIARDLAAAGIGQLKELEKNQINFSEEQKIKINNNAPKLCPYATFTYIKNIKNCASPKWLKDQLASVGINSISAIVDITNYVMLCFNRPMHAYDASKIEGCLNIRNAKNNEKFTSLKNDEFTLDETILVIADDNKTLGIAGIIGSNNSGCSLETSEILLEAAVFDAANVASSGRKLNLQTDSRYRFERGVDQKTCLEGIELATKLILEICGGEASKISIIGDFLPNKIMEFDVDKIKKLIGIEVPKNQVIEILSKLGFLIKEKNTNLLEVEVPSHRHDIKIAQDLVEEVIRIFGYDKIKKENLENIASTNINNPLHQARTTLAQSGMIETINWSFCDENLVEIFAQKNGQLTIKNPISQELGHMRPTLIIGLIESFKRSFLRGFNNLSLFEVGNVFASEQKMMISGIRSGKNKEPNHYHDERDFDIFDVKKDFCDVLEIFNLKLENLQIEITNPPKYYHPHRFAALKLGKNLVGYFGEIHPSIIKKFDLKNSINAFEIFVDNLPNPQKSSSRKAFIINDFPIVERDFAFLIDKNQMIAEIIKTIKNSNKELIKEVNIFDIYQGQNISKDKKSVALKVLIQAQEKTLTSEEIEVVAKKIISEVEAKHQAVLRS
jgi:phenylalanyl-tRNA synthetase beta chain